MYNFDEEYNRKGTNSVKYDILQHIFGTTDVIPMWVADMDFRTPDFILDAIKERLNHEILGYTVRSDSFYQSIINWMKTKHQWEIKKEWISFSPGVVPALSMLINALTKPGDKVIVQTPVYFPFSQIVLDNGRQLVNNQLIYRNQSYSFHFDDLKKGIDSRTRMILLCSPHNPVGRVWKKEELEELADICVKKDILIVSDEIHSDIVFPKYKHVPIASINETISQHTITAFAPSKTFNLAGLSTSFLVFPNPEHKASYENYMSNFHLNQGNIFGNIALEAAYTHGHKWLEEMTGYLQKNIDLVREFCTKNNDKVDLIETEATYLLWLDFGKLKFEDTLLRKFIINKAKLGLNPGFQFGNGGQGFQRMNIACASSTVKRALNQLESAFSSL